MCGRLHGSLFWIELKQKCTFVSARQDNGYIGFIHVPQRCYSCTLNIFSPVYIILSSIRSQILFRRLGAKNVQFISTFRSLIPKLCFRILQNSRSRSLVLTLRRANNCVVQVWNTIRKKIATISNWDEYHCNT